MVCTLNTVQVALPLLLALSFLTMGIVTYYVVDKRKKERQHVGQPYYMSMDLVNMILLVGAAMAFSIVASLGRHYACMLGLLQ